MGKGRLITLEGGEGVGKTTQMERIAEFLRDKGISCLLTREPGGTPLGEAVRQWVLNEPLHEKVELFLLLAARLHHVEQVIAPALAQGQWVICDRFMDSTLVYQGLARNQDTDWIEQWHAQAGLTHKPDLTFLFETSLDIALARRHHTQATCNKFDYAPHSFHERVIRAYHVLAQREPHRWMILPKNPTISACTHAILHALTQRFFEGQEIS